MGKKKKTSVICLLQLRSCRPFPHFVRKTPTFPPKDFDAGITEEEYKTAFHLGCQYTCISLPMLSAREYLQKDNSVVYALAVFMNLDGLSKPILKVECYRKLLLYMNSLTTRQINQIVYALETYLTLTEEEKEIYQKLISEVYPDLF
ncbi:hypothetical protein H8E77_35820 [bacterium]|nr:hypothetical protein [bacterium]